jgi:hypothetical protein
VTKFKVLRFPVNYVHFSIKYKVKRKLPNDANT